MHNLSFDGTLKEFDLIISNMSDADKKNDIMFRRICKEVFQKSYSNIKFQNNLDIGIRVGIGSIIKKSQGRYKKGSFAKSFRKLDHQINTPTFSDLKNINHFLEKSEFVLVVKLLKIQYNYGLKEAISFINSQ